MRVKRILCILLSVIMIISISTAALASDENNDRDIYDDIISTGIGSCEAYLYEELTSLHNNGGVSYGFEWFIMSMLRAGKTTDSAMLDEYYSSVAETIKNWNADVKPTDAERVALALAVMDKDITNVDGVNLVNIICNREELNAGANELAYALIAIYASGKEVPDDAVWNESSIIAELLKFQAADGGFGLYNSDTSDIDMTAICLQALALYRSDETVNNAIDNALEFLRNSISEEWNYADNSNSTAQVLLALATLGIDVTDSENGFGINAQENIITALEKYRNTEGKGYTYGDMVNPMATVQVMQAYDAYRKAHKESLLYWDFGTDGQSYNDEFTQEDTEPDDNTTAETADVYVTIANNGSIVFDKDGGYVAQAQVTVTDLDESGTLTVDEALYAAHEAYYDGGAEAGYASHITTYGLSLAKLWGKGSTEAPTVSGYYLNNASCWSLSDAVKDGDYLTAFNYYDTAGYSDAYSYFSENAVKTEKGNTFTLTLNVLGYDAEWNVVASPCSGAKIEFFGSEGTALTTDENGEVEINTQNLEIGTYYIIAYTDTNNIVPAVCKIDVKVSSEGESGGGSGGSVSNKISVYIRVADPRGITYLKKTAYSVGKGTSAYELLKKTGLKVEVAQSAYGVYVNAIEGLAEFDEGQESGWMYRVNGEFSDCSAPLYYLSDGDYVEWLYTRNLGKDLGENYNMGTTTSSFVKPKQEKTEEKTEESEKIPETEIAKVFTEDTYKDVRADDWYYEAVKYAHENDLMQGTDNGFEPEGKMTRAMLITVLWRAEKEPVTNYHMTFDDIKADEWYTEAVRWASGENIISGIGDNLFGTDNEITREQMATVLYRYVQKKNIETDKNTEISDYADSDAVSDYAVSAVEWALGAGIIKGKTETNISPADSATRAEVATMLMRFFEGISK